MPTVDTPAVSRSGITTSATGERHIPSSTRPDGSIRKEIRVRPGYRPPEDVDVYKNRTAEGFRSRGKGGVPGAEGLKDEKHPTKATNSASAAANKNAKRREARKKAAAAATDGKEEDKPTAVNANTENKEPTASKEPTKSKEPADAPKPVDPEADKEKEAKKLLKKLRQARDLKDKKEKGDVLLPEQFEKVIKINELMRQLENLGFDSDGEKKKAET
ncbi:hypothetical protein K458DRAFT_295144 [Lentithecium fluviatile CBS 122367]|uniref:WIBG Mago-binding domain-containing protein n=1 Tax=Lentithecium fluviatile CBS 122367 TaxID=1168545 RepID=A0A6G1JC70_9PLEO|nr:hypothetical protein K458DRAFT_295144 [Lentithecium fluviatile CBS 122367]